jgi:hypothetical protein
MATTQIRGANNGVGVSQIQAATISNADIHALANIALTKLAKVPITPDGVTAFTAAQSMGGFALTGLPATPSGGTDAACKSYVDNVAQGLSTKMSVRVVATSNVAQTGTQTIDGVALSAGDTVLCIAQTTGSQNGSWTVAAGAWSRTPDFADVNDAVRSPYWFVGEGTANAGNGYVMVTWPYTIGVTSLVYTQFTGAGEIIAGNGISKSGNTLSIDTNVTVDKNTAQTLTNKTFAAASGTTIDATLITGGTLPTARMPALTGDVTSTVNTVATTIANSAVSLAKMANLAANSVIGNSTGGAAVPTAVPMTSAATASTVAFRDGNANILFNNVIENATTIVTAGTTTTLTVASSKTQQFTGSTTQTCVLPNATTLTVGHSFIIMNRSSGVVTLNMNGGGLLQSMAAGSVVIATLINNGTAAGTWDNIYISAGAAGTVSTVSVQSLNGFTGVVTNPTTTPAIEIRTSITGVLKGNGTAISAATAGTDYMGPSNFVVRDGDGGSGHATFTPNGATTVFTLNSTPIVGTEQVYLNGILQEPGAGNDYTISGAAITMLSAPLSGDRLRASYYK